MSIEVFQFGHNPSKVCQCGKPKRLHSKQCSKCQLAALHEARRDLYQTRDDLLVSVARLWLLIRSNEARKKEIMAKLDELAQNYQVNKEEVMEGLEMLKDQFALRHKQISQYSVTYKEKRKVPKAWWRGSGYGVPH